MTSNNEIFPHEYPAFDTLDPWSAQTATDQPPSWSVDSALDLVDSTPGVIPDDLTGISTYHISHDSFEPHFGSGWIVDDLPEIQQLADAASNQVSSLNHAQLLKVKSQLEDVLQKVDIRLQEPFPPIHELPPTPMASSRSTSDALGGFCCPICGRNVKLKRYLAFERHLRLEHGVQRWESRCPEPNCTVTTPGRAQMKNHLRNVHQQSPTPDQFVDYRVESACPPFCNICSQTIHKWVDLWDHAKKHYHSSDEDESVSTTHSAVQYGQKRKREDENKHTLPEEKHSRMDTANAILLHGVNTALDQSFDLSETKPQDSMVHQQKQLSLSLGSGSSNYHSIATNITTPESEEDSIDAGLPETKHMDHILDAARYLSELDELEVRIAQMIDRKNGPHIKLESLGDCIECLENWQAALRCLQSEGFCGTSISILIEDQDRDGVASAVHITLSDIGALVQTILLSADEDASNGLIENWMQTLLNVEKKDLSDFDSLQMLRFLCTILSIGIVSFSGSHVCRFDINLWDQEMEEIPIGFEGYVFKPRKLACLDDFIGGPAWILGKAPVSSEALKISLTVQDLQELWGPVSLARGTANAAPVIQTERGFIIPLLREAQSSLCSGSFCDETECHWMEEIPEYLLGERPNRAILVSSTSRILIGTSTSRSTDAGAGLVVNEKCKSSISLIGQQIASRLQYPGTSKSRYVSDGYDVQLVGGQYVTAGLMKKYKRIPKRTLKAMLIADSTKPDTRLVPLLNLRVGLEVSACTGNAQRVTLWDALRFSQTTTNSTDHTMYCAHIVGDKNCISSCWSRWQSLDEIDSLDHMPGQNKPLTGLEARRVIINSILALEHSGVDSEGNLQVSWPFNNSPLNFPVLPSTPKESHNWFRVVKDTRDTSSFAVFSQRCLEFPEKGIMRSCSAPCKEGHPKPLQTTLLTRILTTAEQGSMSGLLVGVKFLVGEAHLTVTKAVQDQLAIIAAVSMNPLSPLRYRLREILPDARAFDFKEHIWPDITGGVSVPVFVC
ncbi:uncharacterized protein N7487_006979 [Penicillium crustosum]|uniref:uncharacterized protein n=1 Tax=Penicillium crustosum TaxID=36656 RepID=UPI002392F021|nr:uncharacterized protein N7487_006979 [Penicillium crustosum]KAJ5412620.1 hypothetical protein N7487_006979 [Penicillium crustosum]